MKRYYYYRFPQVLCLIICLVFSSQSNLSAQGPCGFDQAMNELNGHFSGIPWLNELENRHQNRIQEIIDNNIDVNVMIPVIVHVVHESNEAIGQGNNILKTRVDAAIASLNADFASTGIQFCPAKRYPDGTPLAEEGIVRVNASSIQGYNSAGITMNGDSDNELKLTGPQFSSYDYLNIWTVKNINASVAGQVLGYASFPLQTAPHLDGITIDVDHFGISNWRVVTHEVGHYFRLYHTFNGDDPDFDGANFVCPSGQGDMVGDTDPHIRSASGTCPTGMNSCNANAPLSQIVNNHMDYSDESCRTTFTPDQIIRMEACILEFRYGLLDPLGCESGCVPLFSAEFSSFPVQPQAPDDNGNNADEGQFTAFDQSLSSHEWFINGLSVTDMDGIDHILNYEFQNSGLYQVCLRGKSNGCSIDYCSEVTVLDAGLCQLPIADPCEILRNGDFSDSYPGNPITVYSNYTQYGPLLNTGGDLTIVDRICNWQNAAGFLQICGWNTSNDYFYGIYEQAGETGLQTSLEIDFQDGVTYEVSVDLAVMNRDPAGIGEVYFALVEDNQFPNTLPSLFEHTTMQSNKIHSLTFNQMQSNTLSIESLAASDFNNYSFTFTYSSEQPKYLFISEHGANFSSSLEDVFIDNISIKQCDFCSAQPQISYNVNCQSFEFMGQNLNPSSGGIVSWRIDGYTIPQSVGMYDFDFSFPFFGRYEVCMDMTCANGITTSSCITVETEAITNQIIITNPDGSQDMTGIACEPCQYPPSVNVTAQRCGTTSNEFLVESFPIPVPKGYRPCLGEFGLTEGYNGTIQTNDYYVDESDPLQDIIHVSFTFLADDPTASMGGLFAVCSPDGSASMCLEFIIDNTQTCDSCEGEENILVSNMTVQCSDSDISDGVLEYRGSFDIQLPNPVYVGNCGLTSSSSGLEETAITQTSPNSFTVDFEISTNMIGGFNSTVTLCVLDNFGNPVCYKILISIQNPCIPDTDTCEEEVLPFTLTCDRVDGTDAVYVFPTAIHIPYLVEDGWVYCDIDPVAGDLITDREPIGLYGQPLITTVGVAAYLFGVEITIPCDDIRLGDNMTSIFLNLCKDGAEICVEVPLILECTECGMTRPQGRSMRQTAESFQLFPIPAADNLTVLVPATFENTTYIINSISGQLIQKGKVIPGENNIETEQLTNGVYYMTISDSIRTETRKFIIFD